MPQYMLLIHADPEKGPAQGSPEMEAQFAQWGEYTQRLTEAGVMRSGAPLQAPATATTVARRNGERLVTDGPFIETKEWLGGYYVVDVAAWPRDGVPANPGAWLTVAARRKAIDRLRRERTLADRVATLEHLMELDRQESPSPDEEDAIVDDRLRLIFTCCHPALAPEARVALTLRTLGGLTTGEIARAFLVSEAAMAQRIVRAKAKIRAAGIVYELPRDSDLPARLGSVLATLYLVFNE